MPQSSGHPLNSLTATELTRGYEAGEFTPTDVAEAVIDTIEAKEPLLGAFYLFDADEVRQEAAASTRRWHEGAALSAYDGVPVTVKENIARKGRPKPSGTAIPNPPLAQLNAPTVDRLEEAGSVITGSTTMPDWGMLSSGVSSLHGITRNGLDPALTAGGSSAGAGTAASAHYGPWHVGTDIGGSIRLPASWQGIVGLKPSDGLIPLDVPYQGRAAGPMTRTVADAVALMRVIAHADARDYLTRPYPPMEWSDVPLEPRGLRVGVQLDAGSGLPVEAGTEDVITRAAALFAEAGAQVEALDPFMPAETLDGLVNFWRSRSYADLERLTAEEREHVLPFIVDWCTAGANFSAAETVRNVQCAGEIASFTRAATDRFDLVLSPVTPVAAFPAEDPMPILDPLETMGHISFTVPYNMSGQPAVSVDAGAQSDGRRIGLQIAGPIGTDDTLLRVARWFEEVRG